MLTLCIFVNIFAKMSNSYPIVTEKTYINVHAITFFDKYYLLKS